MENTARPLFIVMLANKNMSISQQSMYKQKTTISTKLGQGSKRGIRKGEALERE